MAEFELGFNAYSPALFAPAKCRRLPSPRRRGSLADAFREPLMPFEAQRPHRRRARRARLRRPAGARPRPGGRGRRRRPQAPRDGDERVVEKATADGWFALYGFDRMEPRPIDIEANVVAARWERVPFGSNLMLSRQLPDGRVSLLNCDGRTVRARRGRDLDGRVRRQSA